MATYGISSENYFARKIEAPKQFSVVTVCGSMRFWDEMLETAKKLTRHGQIVLMPFVADFIGRDDKHDTEIGLMLDLMHFAKIDMSDSIYVVNPGGYIGTSTRNEIDYAMEQGKGIMYHTTEE